MQRGKFITFEGGEGAGKSTQVRRLQEKLVLAGVPTYITREPGGTLGAEQIRDLVTKGERDRWNALSETLLFMAARADLDSRVIEPYLHQGMWVLCDRYVDSTFVYQGIGRGLGFSRVWQLQRAIGCVTPDLTLVLDVDVEEGLERAKARHNGLSRFEAATLVFHKTLAEGYRNMVKTGGRYVLVDAMRSIDETASDIWDIVKERLGPWATTHS